MNWAILSRTVLFLNNLALVIAGFFLLTFMINMGSAGAGTTGQVSDRYYIIRLLVLSPLIANLLVPCLHKKSVYRLSFWVTIPSGIGITLLSRSVLGILYGGCLFKILETCYNDAK